MNYDVVLIVPPFAALVGPLLGPSVIVPQLRNRGISAKVYYANMILASVIGTTAYGYFTGLDTPGGGTIGEALFSHWARSGDLSLEEAREEIAKILDARQRKEAFVGTNAVNPEIGQLTHEVDRCLEAIPGFLERVYEDIIEYSPKVVGFTSSYIHLAGTIALARTVKQKTPEMIVVIGGPYATSPMGEAIGKACGVIDFVFSGEADVAFPRFVEDFVKRDVLPKEMVIECTPVPHLDDVSIPDYDDYFEQMTETFSHEQLQMIPKDGMLFETSRGCWWAAKNPCTFCGLAARTSQTRCKSPHRVVEEINVLSHRYGVSKLVTADDAFPREYFETLLPQLAAADGPDLELNLRPNLSAADLDTMKKARVKSLLCGVESLATRILRTLNKGVTAQQNLYLLRECRSRNMPLTYGLLMGVPGEDPEDYRAMIDLIPKLEHLHPPRFLLPIKILRLSKYFSAPREFNVRDLTPSPIYRLIFGPDADLAAIAYDFQATIPSTFLQDDALREEFRATVSTWCHSWQRTENLPVLRRVQVLPGSSGIQDTRTCAVQEFYVPDDEEIALLDYLASPRARSEMSGRASGCLEHLLNRNFVVDHEDFLLSLVTSAAV